MVAQSVAGLMSGADQRFTDGNRNYCSKHKRKLVNLCQTHGQYLCSLCTKEHQGHNIEMLENIAQAQVSTVHHLVEHLENSISHVKDKIELRRNLRDKKQVAARQFFDLTFNELRRIEAEFWAKFEQDEKNEVEFKQKLNEKINLMEKQVEDIKPQFEKMEQKIALSEFIDIISSRKEIENLDEGFQKHKADFYDLVNSAQDYDLLFDKIECRNKLQEYCNQQLAVRVHQHELIEVRDRSIYYYQPMKNCRRKVNIEDNKLTENPTLVNTKETGRLLIIGGNRGYRSSQKVYLVDECMNTLQLHSRLKTGRVGHAAVYINNKDIYVIGGYNADENKWLSSVEVCYDAFNSAGADQMGVLQHKPQWEESTSMHEARYYFGCTTVNNEFIFVFGGMNESFMQQTFPEGQSKCLNTIERFSVECNRWDKIELKTYQKFPFLSHLVAVHIPWDNDQILIVGGQTYNKKTGKFENQQTVFKFDHHEDKLKACKDIAVPDRFLMGMGISDGSKQVATLGENSIHLFNGDSWSTVRRDAEVAKVTEIQFPKRM